MPTSAFKLDMAEDLVSALDLVAKDIRVGTKRSMGLIYWDGRILEDEKEDDQLGAKASELKVEFDKMGKKHPLILDVRLPFWKNLRIPYHIRFHDVNKNLGWYDTDLVKPRESNPVSLTCRTTSLVNIPINLWSSEVFVESLRHCRRTRSVGDLSELFVEYASAVAGSGDMMVSPSARFIFDSVNRTVLSRSLVKNSLFFRLGTLDGATRPFRAAPFSTGPMKTSGFTSSPVGVCDSLLQATNSEVTSPGSQVSNLNASDRSLVSCSSMNSTSSYKSSSSPPCLAVSKGLLYFAWKNGSLNILFKEGDDSGKVYAANFRKVESSVGEAMDYLYIFHSKTGNEAAQFIGKMKVFSSLILDLNGSKSVETEFVLFGVENHSREVQHSASSSTKNKGLSKKMAKRLFRSNPSFKHKATSKIDEPSFQLETFLQDPAFRDESKLVDRLENSFKPSLELAAVVVRSSPPCREKEAETGGWGLKFLEKVAEDHADTSIDPLLHSEIHEEGHLENSGASWMSFNVLIPAGLHGGPTTGNSGPSTLTERWRSSGHCDCGGWDIGCPLTVLHDKNLVIRKAFPKGDSQENKTVDLFIEGAKHGEPSLKMVTTREGMYTMYFQPTLSPLQAFLVGVAIIHAQTPALYPKL